MILLFIILVSLACVILGVIVLVQNPKGGGLAGNMAGFSNQFMGVQQTNKVLEKGTWIFAAVIGVLCIVSTAFIPGSRAPRAQTPTQQQQPAQNPGTGAPAPGR